MKKVLLYSGGMDSWLIAQLWKPDVKLYVDMCGSYALAEMRRLASDVVIDRLDLSKWERPDKIIPLRNLYLVALASNYGDEICLGATAGDRVLDKSPLFASKATDLLSYLYQPQWWLPDGRAKKVNLDFKGYTKEQLLRQYLVQGGSLDKAYTGSFSCYDPQGSCECWQCKPCFRKFVAFAKCGFAFPPQIKTLVRQYMARDIMPQIQAGTYGRGDEEADISAVWRWLDGKEDLVIQPVTS